MNSRSSPLKRIVATAWFFLLVGVVLRAGFEVLGVNGMLFVVGTAAAGFVVVGITMKMMDWLIP